tara:strand:+ start:5239 stop:6303 length:1065 start_codon:yes stop_codon:yes gene_type:complete
MTANEKNELCLRLYKDIINGFSVCFREDDKDWFVKHLRDYDYATFEERKKYYKSLARSKGMNSEKEVLELLDKSGNWSKEEEKNLQNLITEIRNLTKSKDKIFLESQKNLIQTRIEEKTKDLEKLSSVRHSAFPTTTEQFAANRLNDYIMSYSFYKDAELKKPLFTFEDFGEMSNAEATSIVKIYNDCLNELEYDNIVRVAASTFFLNSYLLAKGNPYYFYGKNISNLTMFQAMLVGRGNYFKGIIEHTENDIPEFDDVDDLIEWYDREKGIIDSKFNKDKAPKATKSSLSNSGRNTEKFEAIGVVGKATDEEMNTLAIKHDAKKINLVEAAENLKKKLGKEELDARDMVQIHL